MKPLPLNDETRVLAQRIVWFEPPEKALADPVRFLAYAFARATHEEMKVLRVYVDDADLREALDDARPGVIDPRVGLLEFTPRALSRAAHTEAAIGVRGESAPGQWRTKNGVDSPLFARECALRRERRRLNRRLDRPCAAGQSQAQCNRKRGVLRPVAQRDREAVAPSFGAAGAAVIHQPGGGSTKRSRGVPASCVAHRRQRSRTVAAKARRNPSPTRGAARRRAPSQRGPRRATPGRAGSALAAPAPAGRLSRRRRNSHAAPG